MQVFGNTLVCVFFIVVVLSILSLYCLFGFGFTIGYFCSQIFPMCVRQAIVHFVQSFFGGMSIEYFSLYPSMVTSVEGLGGR